MLGRLGVVSVSAKEAERMIEDYLTAHPGPSFPSDKLKVGLEFDITFKTIKKLRGEGCIKKAKK
jgi:hypothetical protein